MAQNFDRTALTDAATIAWDVSSNQVCNVTIAANRTMGTPTNIKSGGIYSLTVIQDGTGGWTISWPGFFVWEGGIAPTLASGPGERTIIICHASTNGLFNAVAVWTA